MPAAVTVFGDSPVVATARQELIRGVRNARPYPSNRAPAPEENAILIGTLDDLRSPYPSLTTLPADAFLLRPSARRPPLYRHRRSNDRGVLYGAFALLRKIALGEPIAELDDEQSPYAPVRWVNEWDNLDGTIERGYGGRSIFWDKLASARGPHARRDYGRLLASLGINGCSINNVNANPRVLSPGLHPADRAHRRRPCGRGACASPSRSISAAPKDRRPRHLRPARSQGDRVVEVARSTSSTRAVPDLGGIVLKADSEGRVGPVGLQSHACRRGQRGGPRAGAARRPALLPWLRLRPSHGLEQSQERPRPRRRR